MAHPAACQSRLRSRLWILRARPCLLCRLAPGLLAAADVGARLCGCLCPGLHPQVRKGMVLVDDSLHPSASWEFDADIAILTHSTTIQPRYQAVIHCEIIRQAARVVAMDHERLRSGDR